MAIDRNNDTFPCDWMLACWRNNPAGVAPEHNKEWRQEATDRWVAEFNAQAANWPRQ